MRILILTQTVDSTHPILGFFHRWIEECATQCPQVTVIGLEVGVYDFPAHVSVYSLGKEAGKGRATYLWRFFTLAWTLRHEYDCVFVHMNPEYVVLGAPLWRLLGKRVALWYTHKSVDTKLRIATSLAQVIFTASKESFRIQSPKVHVVGHGIDTARFSLRGEEEGEVSGVTRGAVPVRLCAVGRVTPTKRLDLILDACAYLRTMHVPAELTIVGAPLTNADVAYERAVRKRVHTDFASVVHFEGAVSQEELPHVLRTCHILVHASETGSLDKVVLEALACGVQVSTTSEAVQAVLPDAVRTLQPKGSTPQELGEAILHMTHLSPLERATLSRIGAEWVEKEHALPGLIARILNVVSAQD